MYNLFIPSDGIDILTKKKLFDQLMLVSRLTEEKQILVKEMMQHCQYLKDSIAKVQTLIATISDCIKTGSKCIGSRTKDTWTSKIILSNYYFPI